MSLPDHFTAAAKNCQCRAHEVLARNRKDRLLSLTPSRRVARSGRFRLEHGWKKMTAVTVIGLIRSSPSHGFLSRESLCYITCHQVYYKMSCTSRPDRRTSILGTQTYVCTSDVDVMWCALTHAVARTLSPTTPRRAPPPPLYGILMASFISGILRVTPTERQWRFRANPLLHSRSHTCSTSSTRTRCS